MIFMKTFDREMLLMRRLLCRMDLEQVLRSL